MTRISGVYALVNSVTGRVYVGQSQNVRNRLQSHFSRLSSGKHCNNRLQRAYSRDGRGAFEARVLRECPVSDLTFWEQYFLDYYLTATGVYNQTGPADSPLRGMKHTEEAKQRMSASKKALWTPERRARFSLYSATRMRDPAIREKIAASLRGRKYTAEARAALAEVRRKTVGRAVEQIHPQTGEVLAEFRSIAEAALAVGVHPSCISHALREENVSKGCLWKHLPPISSTQLG